MVGQRRAPCVQHRRHAEPCADAPGIGGEGQNRLGRGAEQQVIDSLRSPMSLEPLAFHWLTPIGDLRDLGRQGEDDVEISDRQQILGARGHPVPRRRPLTLRAMPVLAGVIGDVLLAAAGATGHMLGPGASVRQASIADITFSRVRLTCPALARRQAGP